MVRRRSRLGHALLTAMSLVEYVIFAPLFEELAFRGLLFAILRRKLRFLPAALISAASSASPMAMDWWDY